MFNIGQFFKNIQNRQAHEAIIQKIISDVIKKHIGKEVEFDRKGGEIKIKNQGSTTKSQLFIKKTLIISEINSQQKDIIITDIR